MIYALLTVIAVVLFITMSLGTTLLVVFCVLLVNIFMLAGMHYWGLTFNNITAANLSFALGIAVDFSSHIAHTYLTIESPTDLTRQQAREFKARRAISQMGSSIFHGGFSTLLSICVLGMADNYIFV